MELLLMSNCKSRRYLHFQSLRIRYLRWIEATKKIFIFFASVDFCQLDYQTLWAIAAHIAHASE